MEDYKEKYIAVLEEFNDFKDKYTEMAVNETKSRIELEHLKEQLEEARITKNRLQGELYAAKGIIEELQNEYNKVCEIMRDMQIGTDTDTDHDDIPISSIVSFIRTRKEKIGNVDTTSPSWQRIANILSMDGKLTWGECKDIKTREQLMEILTKKDWHGNVPPTTTIAEFREYAKQMFLNLNGAK